MEALEEWLEELNYLRIVHERRQVDGLPAGAVNQDYYVIGCNRQTYLTGTKALTSIDQIWINLTVTSVKFLNFSKSVENVATIYKIL